MKDLEKAVLAVMLGKQVDEAKKPLHPNQQKLDVHEPEKDELTAKDFEMLRAGKKAKMKEEIKVMPDEEEMDDEEGDEEEDKKKKKMDEMSKSMAYATGTKKAMQMKGDQPPLEKSTIKKAHDIAKAMLRKEEVEIADDADETVIVHTPFEFELKESYTFGDYLTAAKQLVGEEQAIELANEKFAKQDTSIFVEQFTRTDIEDKVKTHEKAGHKVSTPKYSTKSGKPYAEYVVTDKESGVRRKYIHHGNARSVENMGAVGKKEE